MGNQRSKIRRTTRAAIKHLLAAYMFFASLPALSAIPYRNAYEAMDLINQETKELNLSLFAKIQFYIEQNQFSLNNYVPLHNLPQHDNGEVIARRIFKKTMQSLFDSDATQSSPLLHQAEELNSSMSSSIERHGHSLRLRVKPLEAEAEVKYSGAVDAILAYDVNHSEMKFEVSKNIGEQTYAYTHIDGHDGSSVDQIGVRWSF